MLIIISIFSEVTVKLFLFLIKINAMNMYGEWIYCIGAGSKHRHEMDHNGQLLPRYKKTAHGTHCATPRDDLDFARSRIVERAVW
jgi:hypothetical protein